MKVRQLVWEDRPILDEAVSECSFGRYTVIKSGLSYVLERPDGGYSGHSKWWELEEAKAAAQADFESRVKACLE